MSDAKYFGKRISPDGGRSDGLPAAAVAEGIARAKPYPAPRQVYPPDGLSAKATRDGDPRTATNFQPS
ncbi:MAG: hypothetical protein EB121_08615 [Alphaproteobacteria bacterium]|nr:hypothetical protein [Alphaproteobacteria bacterium]NDG05388.1 hypothetical protein [Alphaproteobacteria bacterium]